MKKRTQILILVFLILLILGGGYYFLLKLEVLPVPSSLKNIPVISSLLFPDTNGEESELQKNMKENEKLENDLAEKNTQLEEINIRLKSLQKELEEGQSTELQQKEEILKLQDEIDDLKLLRSNKEATYKNLAEYYTEMKMQNAAEIMQQLDDEDIIGIFDQMDSETAAQIMQNMDRDRAAVISEKMLVPSPI